MTVLIAIGLSFVVSLGVTPLLRWLSHRHDLLDHPNERSSHDRPTPRSGGAAILLAGVLPLFLFGAWQLPSNSRLLVCAAAIAALGLLDDLTTLPAIGKLVVQVTAGGAAIALLGLTLSGIELPMSGHLRLPFWVGIGASLFWIVGVTNAYNFMDGINGIAAIESIVCALTYAVLFWSISDSDAVLLCLGLAGASAGFLVFNASGSIFMGDVGSATLGFLFAGFALRLAGGGVQFLAVLLPLMPFLLDTSLTLARRARRGEQLFRAHRTHAYQRLTDLGWSHMAVSTTYGLMAACCSVVAILWSTLDPAVAAAAFAFLTLLMIAGSLLAEQEVTKRQA